MALTGTFEDVAFAELLQLLNVGHRSGRLRVWRGEEQAEIRVSNGDVVWARTRFERGAEVVYRVLGWQTGEFSFTRNSDSVLREISESTEALILEGMKRFDEWARVEADLPGRHLILRQRAGAAHARFEELSVEAQGVLRLVNARRTIAAIIRECGLEPLLALNAVAELQAEGLVEEWSDVGEEAAVLSAKDHLPAAAGGIEFQHISQAGASRKKPARRVERATPQGGGEMEKRDEHTQGAHTQ